MNAPSPELVLAALEARCHKNPVSGCWEWTNVATKNGYAMLGIGGAKLYAHRLSQWIGERLAEHLRAEVAA